MKGITSRLIPAITLLPLTILLSAQSLLAETLLTHNFKVTITRNCRSGSVTCSDVTYVGRELTTGNSIRLKGKTMQRMCADRVTPCQFIGYEFRNRDYRYVVTANGILQVYRGTKLLLIEKGTWD